MPIFRDRDDLPAGSDLTQEVQAALRDSRFLVVICSPAAAQSKWVNQEIMLFKRLHGEGRVLAAIVDGEPFAEDKTGEGFAECFPKALRHRLSNGGGLGEERRNPSRPTSGRAATAASTVAASSQPDCWA